jgi:hypothetical protein
MSGAKGLVRGLGSFRWWLEANLTLTRVVMHHAQPTVGRNPGADLVVESHPPTGVDNGEHLAVGELSGDTSVTQLDAPMTETVCAAIVSDEH